MINTLPANTLLINSDTKKVRIQNRLFCFAHVFISGHFITYDRYYLLLLHKSYVKTKKILAQLQHENEEK